MMSQCAYDPIVFVGLFWKIFIEEESLRKNKNLALIICSSRFKDDLGRKTP